MAHDLLTDTAAPEAPAYPEFLIGADAHAAAARAVGRQFIVADCGERRGPGTIVFEAWRRGPVHEPPHYYRVQLRGGVIYGSWVAPAPVPLWHDDEGPSCVREEAAA
jgi:hypothetical protein